MKAKPKNEKEIKQEIAKLKSLKHSVRRYSVFGGDNWAKIEAQIKALDDDMTEDDTYDEWPEEEADEEDPETREVTMDIRSDAQYAIRWADGEEKEPPSKGWEPLTKG